MFKTEIVGHTTYQWYNININALEAHIILKKGG